MKRRTLVILSSVLLAIVVGVRGTAMVASANPTRWSNRRWRAADKDAAPSSAPNAEGAKTKTRGSGREVARGDRTPNVSRRSHARRSGVSPRRRLPAPGWAPIRTRRRTSAAASAERRSAARRRSSTAMLENGETIRIKYGSGREIPAEVAAARLLTRSASAPTTSMLVEKLRCYGCPAEPFSTMKARSGAARREALRQVDDYKDIKDFEWVAVERKHYGRPIETEKLEGWAFFELDLIDREEGRRAARARRRAAPAGRVPGALGQQEREPAPGVPLGEGLAGGRQSARAVRDAAGRRLDVGPAQGRSRGVGEGADLGRPRQLHDVDGRAAVSRRDLQAGEDHRGRPAAPRRPALAAVRSADRPICSAARASIKRRGALQRRRTPVAEWVRVFKAKVKPITDGPPCPQ